MESYDLFMLMVLGAATLFGFYKGFAWQVASVASIVLSYLAALRFSPQVAPKFTEWGFSAPLNKFAAMLAVYVVTSAAIWLAFRLVSGAIDRVRLKEFDHQLGAMLGLAKGVLWCVAITFFAVTLLPQAQKETIVSSRAGHYIVVLLDRTESAVPPEIHDVIAPYIDRARQPLVDPNYQQPNPFGTPSIPFQDLQGIFQGRGFQGQGTPGGPQAQQPAPQQGGGQDLFPQAPNPFTPHAAGQPAQTNPY